MTVHKSNPWLSKKHIHKTVHLHSQTRVKMLSARGIAAFALTMTDCMPSIVWMSVFSAHADPAFALWKTFCAS